MSDPATVAPLGTRPTPAEVRALRAWRRHGSIVRAARSLARSPYTVRDQLRNVRSRLGVETNAEAAHRLLD